MSSKKIIPNLLSVTKSKTKRKSKKNKSEIKDLKNLSKDEEMNYILYFGENYKTILELNESKILFDKKYKQKINTIVNYIVSKYENFSKQMIDVIFSYTFKKLIYEFIPTSLRKEFTYNKVCCKERLDNFFNRQRETINITELLSIINFQSNVLTMKNLFKELVKKENDFIFDEVIQSNELYRENEDITDFITDYLDKVKVEKLPTTKFKNILTMNEQDSVIIKILSKIFNNVVIKLQKLIAKNNNNINFKIITYGSYSAFAINNEIDFNDIDIYINDPQKFLSCMLLLYHFILDINVDIFKIPLIIGHLSLRYKTNHFADCLYLDNDTLKNIKTITIKNLKILDPLIQIINNFRMFSEIRRIDSITKNKINSIKKYSTMLNKANEQLKIDFTKLKKTKIHYKIIDNNYLVFDLKKTFCFDVKENDTFDYLVIPLLSSKAFFELVNRDDSIFSRQYFAIFNEVVVEFHNRNKKMRFIENEVHDLGNRETIEIQESELNRAEKNDYIFSTELDELINTNNVILMSNFTSNVYIENVYNEQKRLIKRKLTDISKESILFSFVLYNILKNKNKNLINQYMEKILGFVKYSEKKKEYEHLAGRNDNIQIIIFDKIKLKGNYISNQLKPKLFLMPILFYASQKEDYYYKWDDFIDVTSYNY